MSKRKRAASPRRTGRGTKGAMNPLLPQELQGRVYKVRAFTVQPEITLYAEDGKEERRFLAPITIAIYESNFDKPIPSVMEKHGLKMEGGPPK